METAERVRRHQRRRDRHRFDWLRAPASGADFDRGDQEDHRQTDQYLFYSHHHYPHIGGGKPFKDAGAKIIAHKRAKERLAVLKAPATPLPDETMDKKRIFKLGGTTLERTHLALEANTAPAWSRFVMSQLGESIAGKLPPSHFFVDYMQRSQ